MKRLLNFLIRYGKGIAIAVMVAILMATGWFFYLNAYRPLTQAAVLAELKSRVALVNVNRGQLRAVLERLALDQAPLDVAWDTLRNPFIPEPIAAEPPPELEEPPSPTPATIETFPES